ncbi:hypothetical protein [Arthrobacter agilis]|uniref:hypothetical protein n=1 Tax=Arthrobacter agilis TaxID=37921 RepID=UPI00277EED3D|nr:hypothetical protein [Arthrobacter agilis]MDQ0735929.1 hypothetical protein [Arthrobacter agilis]
MSSFGGPALLRVGATRRSTGGPEALTSMTEAAAPLRVAGTRAATAHPALG